MSDNVIVKLDGTQRTERFKLKGLDIPTIESTFGVLYKEFRDSEGIVVAVGGFEPGQTYTLHPQPVLPKDVPNKEGVEIFQVSADVLSHLLQEPVLHPESQENIKQAQMAVLGEFYSNLWPPATPRFGNDQSNLNFLFGAFELGSVHKSQIEKFATPQTDAYGFGPKVGLLRGPSGAGKTRLLFQFAKNGHYVIAVNCGAEGALRIPSALKDIQKALPGPWHPGFEALQYPEAKIWQFYWDLKDAVAIYFWKQIVAHLHFFVMLVKVRPKVTPVELLRLLDDGATLVVADNIAKLHSTTLSALKALKTNYLLELQRLGYRPMFAFDEVQDLLKSLNGYIPFGAHGDEEGSTTLSVSGHLINGTCSFSVLVREAFESGLKTLFFGTAFSLLEATAKSSVLREQATVCLDKEFPLLPWGPQEVLQFTSYYLKVPLDVLNDFKYILQGRARITIFFLQNIFAYLKHDRAEFTQRDQTLNVRDLFYMAIIKTEAMLVRMLDPEYRKTKKFIVHNGVVLTKADVLRQVLLNENSKQLVGMPESVQDTVCRSMVMLSQDGVVKEPLIKSAMKRILIEKGVDLLAEVGNSGAQLLDSQTTKTGTKGPWSEFAFAHILLQAAAQLNGQPMTTHPLFAELQGTIYDNYTLEVSNMTFEPGAWIDGNDSKTLYMQLDTLLRWNMYTWLCSIKPNCNRALMVVGVKLHHEISEEDFCDNIFTTIADFAFTNAKGQILNAEKRAQFEANMRNNSEMSRLGVSFIFGGFPKGVKRVTQWKYDNHQTVLIIDHFNEGIGALPQPLLNSFAFLSKSAISKDDKAMKTPMESLQKFIITEQEKGGNKYQLKMKFYSKQPITAGEWESMSQFWSKKEIIQQIITCNIGFPQKMNQKTTKKTLLQYLQEKYRVALEDEQRDALEIAMEVEEKQNLQANFW